MTTCTVPVADWDRVRKDTIRYGTDSDPVQQTPDGKIPGSRLFTSTGTIRGVAAIAQRDEGLMQGTFVNLGDAHLCCNCEAIGDSASRCPRCQSDALIAVTRAIHRNAEGIKMICEAQLTLSAA